MPKPQPITLATEERIADAIRLTAGLVASGDDPTDAMEKSAAEYDLLPHQIALATHAYNVGQSEATRKNGVDKFGSYRPVDGVKVIERLYPDEPVSKQAAYFDTDFDPDRPPERRKVAFEKSADEAKPAPAANVWRELCNARAVVDRLEVDIEGASYRLDQGVQKLAHQLLRDPDYAEVKGNCLNRFGKVASALFALIDKTTPPKIAADKVSGIMRLDRQPYAGVVECMRLAGVCAELHDKLAAAAKDRQRWEKEFNKLGKAKQANAMGTLGNQVLGGSLSESLRQKLLLDTDEETAKAKAEGAFDDPAQTGRIREARVTTLLNRLLSDDEVISKHQPDEVTRQYNEMASIAPRAALDEGVARSELRRRLEGGANATRPFDIDQLIKLDRAMSGNPGILEPKPTSVL